MVFITSKQLSTDSAIWCAWVSTRVSTQQWRFQTQEHQTLLRFEWRNLNNDTLTVTLTVTWQWVQSFRPYKCPYLHLSSWIAVRAMPWKLQTNFISSNNTVGMDKYRIIHPINLPKFSCKQLYRTCILSFCCIFASNDEAIQYLHNSSHPIQVIEEPQL